MTSSANPVANPASMIDPAFRERALAEAARYGSDSYVFLRELLQNARDAGATRVVVRTEKGEQRERLSVRDDGCGMNLDHARRYFFALYASSKESDAEQAGKFGVGFWSTLRFHPQVLRVRSKTADAESAWRVELDGRLENVKVHEDAAWDGRADHGTEIVLERLSVDADLSAEAFAAACRYGRFLKRRDGDEAMEVFVDGRSIHQEFTLPAPSASFSERGFRGVVGLGPKPQVELFSHGLFVRSAVGLHDLRDPTSAEDAEGAEDGLADLPRMAPQILLDSNELDLMLARSDPRQDRQLRRLLNRAERELARLATRHLQSLRPQPWWRRQTVWLGVWMEKLGVLAERVARKLPGRRTRRLFAGALVVALTAGAFFGSQEPHWSGWEIRFLQGEFDESYDRELFEDTDLLDTREDLAEILSGEIQSGEAQSGEIQSGEAQSGEIPSGVPFSEEPAEGGALVGPASIDAAGLSASPASAPPSQPSIVRYRDLSGLYGGPRPGGWTGGTTALMYTPPDAVPLFNALAMEDPSTPSAAASRRSLRAYVGTPCRSDCIDLKIMAAPRTSQLRLPIPTGHRLDVATLSVGGRPVETMENELGEAIALLPRDLGGGDLLLEYRTGPGPARMRGRFEPERREVLAELAFGLTDLPVRERVQIALDRTAERIPYRRDAELAALFEDSLRGGADFVETALALGAGDCDVQNGVVVALLRHVGVPARLAIGWIGYDGVAAPGLHAWVEYLDDDDFWHAADASVAAEGRALGEAVSLPTEVWANDVLLPAQTRDAIAAIPPSIGVRRIWPTAAGAGFLALVLWGVSRRRGGDSRRIDLGEDGDLAALLGGALRHPEAFASMPAILHGAFVPVLGRRAGVSLAKARRLAGEGRLFCSAERAALARRAASRGACVVDTATAEGRTVAGALGALDLDRWAKRLDESRETEITQRIDRLFKKAGKAWRLRSWEGDPETAVVEVAVDLFRGGERTVLYNVRHPDFATLDETALGTLRLLAALLPRLDAEEKERARILAAAASAALREAAGEDS